jgi:DNA-binding SARP family transcriptional activator
VAHGRLISDMFEVLPTPVLLVTEQRRPVTWNAAMAELFGDELGRASSCCDVLGCGRAGTDLAHVCLTELAMGLPQGADDYVIQMPGVDGATAVSVRPIAGGCERFVVIQLRPAGPASASKPIPPPASAATIRIRTLGKTSVELPGGEMVGDWLEQRPGQLLKFLIARRGTAVHADAITEALWPRARSDSTNAVRHFVHTLREKLEPSRDRYARSAFVIARNGGYMLDTGSFQIDSDEFEREAAAGLSALDSGRVERAIPRLEAAMELYGGDFLVDERYEDWAIIERERLLDLACQVLRALAANEPGSDKATHYLERLADLEPLDADVQRQLISTWLRQGKRTRALRRYRTLQSRLMREFGERITFDLAELARTDE